MKRALKIFRPSPAMVIACMALLFSLGGVGYAAVVLPGNSVGTKQLKKNAVVSTKVKDHSLLRVDFKSGQVPEGARGATGATGAAGAVGAPGIQGQAGPFPDTLPTGKTIRGRWGMGFTATAGGQFFETHISFVYPLATAPTAHFIAFGGTPPAECPGTAANPQAAAGHVCVYEDNAGNSTSTLVCSSGGCPGADKYGAQLRTNSAAAGGVWTRGTWAVTGS
jgi:hypothetical protein